VTILKTNTPLDTWMGGLPLKGITLVTGDMGSGKMALLRAIAAERATPQTPTAYISRNQKYAGGFRLDKLSEVVDVVSHLHTMEPKPVILIDDAQDYMSPIEPAGKAKTWAGFVRNPSFREHCVVIAAQTRRVAVPGDKSRITTGLGQGVTYGADMILTTEVQASIRDGIILRITCEKCRWADTAKMAPFLMAVVHDDELGWRGEAA